MSLLTKEQILSADDLKWEDVECPEWGGTVRIREMSGPIRDLFDAEARRVKKDGGDSGYISPAFVTSLCAVNSDGTRMFVSKEEVEALHCKSPQVLTRLFFVALKISGLSKDEQDTIEKN